MSAKSICTIIAKNYISYARSLCSSFMEHDKDGYCFVLMVDEVGDYINPKNERFDIINIEELQIPNLREFCFKYNITELCTAVKPYFLKYLLDEKGLEKLLYVDPDVLVTHSLGKLFDQLEGMDIVVTPHLDTDYPDDGLLPDDGHIMKSGIFNLGFLGIRNCRNVHHFLLWWQNKLYNKCVIRHGSGYFVDQKFMDLAFCLFRNISIVTDTGFNVAYWNLHSRRIEYVRGNWKCNGKELYFFHFSGYRPEVPDQISKYQNRLRLSTNQHLKMLFDYYRERLVINGYNDTMNWPYTYGSFTNGRKVDDLFRKLYLLNIDRTDVRDPFDYYEHSISFKVKYTIARFYVRFVGTLLGLVKMKMLYS